MKHYLYLWGLVDFSGNMIKNFFNNLINFHPTRLPQNSGATPFSWQILRGDRISIRLIHLIEKEIDKGPIIYFDKSILPNSCQIPKDFENIIIQI